MRHKLLQLGFLAFLCLIVGAAHVLTAERYLGVYSMAQGSSLSERLEAQRGWTNVVSVPEWCGDNLMDVREAHRRAVCTFPWNWAIRMKDAQGRWLYTPADIEARGDFQWWAESLTPYRADIAVIDLDDEPDCGVPLSQWNAVRCNAMSARLDAFHDLVRRWVPDVPTRVNYTAPFFYWFSLPNAGGVRFPQKVDWLSMDSYTPWTCAYGCGISHDRLLDNALRWFQPHQKLALVPQGMTGFGVTNPSEVASIGWRYLQYAQARPRVVAILPFIWESRSTQTERWRGMQEEPIIRQAYEAIGRIWLAVTEASQAPPSPVTGLRIVREP